MLAHPRVIRRALPGEVERDLEAEPLGFGTKRVEVVERAEPGLDRGVPAVRRSDRPRAAGIARRRRRACCSALAEAACRSDGSAADRRRRIRGRRCAAARRAASRNVAAAGRIRAGRARKHLVPRAEARALAVDPDAARRRDRRRAIDPHSANIRAASPSSSAAVQALVDRRRVAQRVGPFEQPVRIGCRRRAVRRGSPPRGRAATLRAARARRPGPAAAFALEVAAPGQEAIDPGDDLRTRASRSASTSNARRPLVGARRDRASSAFRASRRRPTRTRGLAESRLRGLGARSAIADPWRSRSTATTTSWPSAKMSAVTSTRSPTVRLMGKRPPSISGCTCSTIDAARGAAVGSRSSVVDSPESLGRSSVCRRSPAGCQLLIPDLRLVDY